MRTPTVLITLAVAGLTALTSGCGSGEPEAAPLAPAERESQFWTAYEQRLGMVGRDYADPAKARAVSIEFGHFLCGELAKGMDGNVLIAQGSRSSSREEMQVKVDTAVEFLCPEQGGQS